MIASYLKYEDPLQGNLHLVHALIHPFGLAYRDWVFFGVRRFRSSYLNLKNVITISIASCIHLLAY